MKPPAKASLVQQQMRQSLPYGKWTCADGREVLFNRHYKSIWQRAPGTPAEAANPDERVKFEKEDWFYDDANPPWKIKATRLTCERVLVDWGVGRAAGTRS